jgi:hypothetical protein
MSINVPLTCGPWIPAISGGLRRRRLLGAVFGFGLVSIEILPASAADAGPHNPNEPVIPAGL